MEKIVRQVTASTGSLVRKGLMPLAALGLASLGFGHLTLIRQGKESAFVMEQGDAFGRAVVSGDFDGDGFDDLATGAPFENLTADPFIANGVVIINYGSVFGLTHEGATARTASAAGYNPAEQAGFGHALAAGDFNNDGFDDLAVGAPRAIVGGQDDAGLVFVYYGTPDGLGLAPQIYSQASVGASPENGDRFGFALTAGRIGSSPSDDLFIGSPGEDSDRGAVAMLPGTAGGLTTTGSVFFKPGAIGADAANGDEFGRALEVGSVVGVAWNDLMIGTPFREQGATNNAGEIHVVPGSGSGLALGDAIRIGPGDVGLTLEPQLNFGFALTSGDFFVAGGLRDLAIGAPGANIGAGVVVLGQGHLSGPGAWQVMNQQSGGGSVAEVGDRFGYALASGDWNNDGLDDLGVGSPTEDWTENGTVVDTGQVQVFLGGNGGPATNHEAIYNESNLGDVRSFGSRLGHALTFGRFDDTSRANLAAGAPSKNLSTGQVYVIAPWRQVQGLTCRSTVVVDCEENLIQTLRPFEPVLVASTTKIMTVLLACERALLPANHPDHIPLTQDYVVQPWMGVGFPPSTGCSAFGLVPGEIINFEALMRTCIMVSGNDAAHALGDVMTGEQITTWNNHAGTNTDFVAQMNQAAAQLGMNDTNFTNPPGVDNSTPLSSAHDMYLLSRRAMKNPLFADIVGTSQYLFNRRFQGGGGMLAVPTLVNYGWLQGLLNGSYPNAVGLKPGSTPGAGSTRVYSVRQALAPWGMIFVTAFGWMNGIGNEAADLMDLALAECGGGLKLPPPQPDPGSLAKLGGLSLLQDSQYQVQIYNQDTDDGQLEDVDIEIVALQLAASSPQFDLRVMQQSSLILEPGERVAFGIDGFLSHEGFTIRNQGQFDSVLIDVRLSHPPTLVESVLAPNQTIVLPPSPNRPSRSAIASEDFVMTVHNAGHTSVELGVRENGYRFANASTVPSDAVDDTVLEDPLLERTLRRNTAMWQSNVVVDLFGRDSSLGNEVALSVKRAGTAANFNPCDPGWRSYGTGWPGAAGVPVLVPTDLPRLGSKLEILVGNSASIMMIGLLQFGFEPAMRKSALDGFLLVRQSGSIPIVLPKLGRRLQYEIPADPGLCGLSIFMQILERDARASAGVSFSRGLELMFGRAD